MERSVAFRRVAEQTELERQVMRRQFVDIGVDAAHIGLDDIVLEAGLLLDAGQVALRAPQHPRLAQGEVGIDEVGPHDAGKPARGHPREEVHLEEPILCDRIPQRGYGVEAGTGEDVGYAAGIADEGHLALQARDSGRCQLRRRRRPTRGVVEPVPGIEQRTDRRRRGRRIQQEIDEHAAEPDIGDQQQNRLHAASNR